ncbi:MAG: FRG domain-containing protein [Lacticaseibacillus paracasei]
MNDQENQEVKDQIRKQFEEENVLFVSTISDYIEKISSLKSKMNKKETILYRGENGFFQKSIPGIYRNEKALENEPALINDARRLLPKLFSAEGPLISKLAFLQHHGLPTRTLDLTGNALVALFFATQKKKRSTRKDYTRIGTIPLFSATSVETDVPFSGKDVWADYTQNNKQKPSLKSTESDTVAVISALTTIPFLTRVKLISGFANTEEIKKLQFDQIGMGIRSSKRQMVCKQFNKFYSLYQNLEENQIKDIKKSFNHSSAANELIREIRRYTPNFEGGLIDPLDLFRDVVVRLDQTDPRIARQDGYLLLVGESIGAFNREYNIKGKDNDYGRICEEMMSRINKNRLRQKNGKATRFVILDDNAKNIRKELSTLGFSSATVYPDTDHVVQDIISYHM